MSQLDSTGPPKSSSDFGKASAYVMRYSDKRRIIIKPYFFIMTDLYSLIFAVLQVFPVHPDQERSVA
jgi:hypothetical protein